MVTAWKQLPEARTFLFATRNGPLFTNGPFSWLVLFFTCFLAAALASERFFDSLPLAGLQVKRVTFYFLNDVLGLYLSFEPPKRVFEGFSLLKSNFRQRTTPPHSSYVDLLVMARLAIVSQVDYERFFIPFKNSGALKIASAAVRMNSSPS
jgi:hypothetical protein